MSITRSCTQKAVVFLPEADHFRPAVGGADRLREHLQGLRIEQQLREPVLLDGRDKGPRGRDAVIGLQNRRDIGECQRLQPENRFCCDSGVETKTAARFDW